ncbi:hypothetical protein AVEN_38967-1 [Araneus ventricosus]|uniref:Uncharacterized protein n=1 Tax=Araneus ventricosus TaxID=182803 RepID=A0A4Y2MP63_ARAVE|nr:hypothetical protein AVEN_38967-1 [Araneus ventricosus]
MKFSLSRTHTPAWDGEVAFGAVTSVLVPWLFRSDEKKRAPLLEVSSRLSDRGHHQKGALRVRLQSRLTSKLSRSVYKISDIASYSNEEKQLQCNSSLPLIHRVHLLTQVGHLATNRLSGIASTRRHRCLLDHALHVIDVGYESNRRARHTVYLSCRLSVVSMDCLLSHSASLIGLTIARIKREVVLSP